MEVVPGLRPSTLLRREVMSRKSDSTPTISTPVHSAPPKKTGRRPSQHHHHRAIKRLEHLELRRMLAAHIVGDPNNISYASIQTAIDSAPANATINVDA